MQTAPTITNAPPRPLHAWPEAAPLPRHRQDFERLARLLRRRGHFALLIAQCDRPDYRDALIASMAEALDDPPPALCHLPEEPSPDALTGLIAMHAANATALHLLGAHRWPADQAPALWRRLNYRREAIADSAPLPMVLWLSPKQVRDLAETAPDLWAWRAAVLDFSVPARAGLTPAMMSMDEPTAQDPARAQAQVERIEAYLRDHPDAEGQAGLLLEAATAHAALADWVAAAKRAEQALQHFRASADTLGSALALRTLGRAKRGLGYPDEAMALLREAVASTEAIFGADHPSTASALAELAGALRDTYRLDEAVTVLDRVIAILQAAGHDSGDPEQQNHLAGVYSNRGIALSDRGDFEAAIADYDAAIRLMEALRLGLSEQLPPVMQNDLAGVYSNRGIAHKARGDLEAAMADYGEAIGLGDALHLGLGEQWPPDMQNDLAAVYLNLGLAHGQACRFKEAIAEFERAIAILRPLVDAYPQVPVWRDTLKRAERGLALVRQLAAGEARD